MAYSPKLTPQGLPPKGLNPQGLTPKEGRAFIEDLTGYEFSRLFRQFLLPLFGIDRRAKLWFRGLAGFRYFFDGHGLTFGVVRMPPIRL